MKRKAFLYVILAGIFWGTSGIFVNFLAPYGLSSLQITGIRSIMSAVIMGIYLLIFDRTAFRIKPAQLIMFLGIGVSIFATAYFYFGAIRETTISVAVVLMYTAPAFVMTYSVAFLGEKLTKLKFLSVVLVIAGCCFVSGVFGNFKFSIGGILMGVMSGVAYSSYNILTRIAMNKGYKTMTTTFYSFLVTAILGFIFSDIGAVATVVAETPSALFLMVGIGIVSCVAPYLFYTTALKHIHAGTASSLCIVEPMAASLFGVIIFKEVMDIPMVIGVVLILIAVFLLSKSE